ncbi:hypothetical protein BH23ACT9_BH23ACT9_18080 [soil metagenome]
MLASAAVQVIPGYGPLAQIGAGGSAVVYRAEQEGLARQVALKVLAAPSLDAKTDKRFSRESRALGSLGWHPNIVVLYDVGTTPAGAPYIAMEHLSGGSLADLGPMDPPDVTSIGIKIAGALHCAHEAGVLHRDVKPANILRSPLGEPKLADFGISGLVDATHTTGGGMTLDHVAPEVVDGRQASVSSDVYSLASTLYELATGRSPFAGAAPEAMVALLLRILDAPVPDCRHLGIPDALATVLEQGLSKDPAARPDAAAFGRTLQQVQRRHAWAHTDLPLPPGDGGTRAPAPPASTAPQPRSPHAPPPPAAGHTIPMDQVRDPRDYRS